MRRALSIALVASLLCVPAALAADFIVAAWNVESDPDTNPALVAQRMATFPEVDVWGLSEVQNDRVGGHFRDSVARATGVPFQLVMGRTGGGDRLAILVKTTRFDLVRSFELTAQIHAYCEGTYRPRNRNGNFPSFRGTLVAQLRWKGGGAPAEFFLMVNHLHRGNEAMRNCQAEFLNAWVRGAAGEKRRQTLPIVAVGDYNFDWDPPSGPGNGAYALFTSGNIFARVKPTQLFSTQCDPAYSSILDFVFVANRAQRWTAAGDIVSPVMSESRDQYCRRDPLGDSDHLIVRAAFSTR